jgi:hypothetical protein
VTLRRVSAALLALVLALAVGACGNKHETITEAETEGLYVDLGGLTYQVQISRQLNPRDVEDQTYLKGLPPGTPPLKPSESWFAVFLRVNNESDLPLRTTQAFRITDTNYEEGRPCLRVGGCYLPVRLDPSQNAFAYARRWIDPREIFPPPSTNAEQGVVGGTMVLFRLPYSAYEDRPLELHMAALREPREAVITLDL